MKSEIIFIAAELIPAYQHTIPWNVIHPEDYVVSTDINPALQHFPKQEQSSCFHMFCPIRLKAKRGSEFIVHELL
jgi:hypothetical protein